MSTPLLFPEDGLREIKLPGARLEYAEDFDLGVSPDALFRDLLADTPWRQESVTVWGKRHLQPRLVCWYGDPGKSYTYSGIRLEPLPWTTALNAIRRHVESAAETQFNSVLLNLYRDENDSMGFHSDDEAELGLDPIIASVSLGSTRSLVFKSKHDKTLRPRRIPLAHGSLLLMSGKTQENWNHGIPRESGRLGPRVNLTFRRIVDR